MFLTVNNIKLYCEKLGQGPPLLLLHGNNESHEIFTPLAESLKDIFTLYMPDSRGHGKSENAPLDYYLMAQDIYGLIQSLGLKKPHLMGFSDGGIIALLLAANYPECISSLIAAGANLSVKAFKPHVLISMQLEYLFKRDPKLRLMLKQPEIPTQTLGNIAAPSLIIAGEKDVFPLKHTLQIAQAIADSHLLIVKGKNHSNYIYGSDMLSSVIAQFCLKHTLPAPAENISSPFIRL